jgi:hypothetical protein
LTARAQANKRAGLGFLQRRGGRQAVQMNGTRTPMTALWEAPQRSG